MSRGCDTRFGTRLIYRLWTDFHGHKQPRVCETGGPLGRENLALRSFCRRLSRQPVDGRESSKVRGSVACQLGSAGFNAGNRLSRRLGNWDHIVHMTVIMIIQEQG
jgi:hypothetical protein